MTYGQKVLRLIEECRGAQRAGATLDEIRDRVLPDKINSLIAEIAPQDFLEWVKEDREHSFYYYDAQQSGVCAKAAEAAAAILEAIALDALA